MADVSLVTLTLTRVYNASAERVFDAWLDQNTAGQWLFATPKGKMVSVAIDAKVGGTFSFVDRRGETDVEHVGEYLEITRPKRLKFKGGVPKFSPDFTNVTVDITPQSNTSCELILTHEGVTPDLAAFTEKGWERILSGLEQSLR